MLQVEKIILFQKVELGTTLRNISLQLAKLKFVVWQVEHAVVIRATCSTSNATMLYDNLNNNMLPVLRGLYLHFQQYLSNEDITSGA